MITKELLDLFNEVNFTSKEFTENTDKVISRAIVGLDPEDVKEVIAESAGEPFSYLFNNSFLKTKIELKELKKAKKQQPVVDQIGLIEQALANVIVEKEIPKWSEIMAQQAKKYIEDIYGVVEKKVIYKVPEHGQVDEVTHEKFEQVLNYVMMNEPVMLVGPAGTGKNVICKQVAKALGLDFYFTNAVTQEYKLTGFIDANGRFHETEFYKAFKNGGLFMLDEMDASIPEVLVILNAAIANRYFDFPNGRIEASKDFRVVSAGNTYGKGASFEYVGRNQLDGASLDRFAVVEINYSPRIEESLTDDKELLEFVRDFRKCCESAGINHIVSYRCIIRLSKMLSIEGMNKKDVMKESLFKNLDEDDLKMIFSNMDCANNKYYKMAGVR